MNIKKLLLIILGLFLLQCGRDIIQLDLISLEKRISWQWSSGPHDKISDTAWVTAENLQLTGRNDRNFLWYKIALPETEFTQPYLYIPNTFQIFEVLLENRVIYKSGEMANPSGSQFKGVQWHLVPLPDNPGGKIVYIHVYSNNRFLIGFSSPPVYGNKHSILTKIIEKNYGIFFTGLTNLLVFFISFIGFVVVKDKIFLYFSLNNLVFGIYFINMADTSQFLYHDPVLKVIIWEVTVVLAALTFKLYYTSLFSKNRYLDYWSWIYLLFIILKYPVHGIDSFDESSIALNLLVLTGLIFMVVQTLLLALKKNKYAIVFLIPIFLITATTIYDTFSNNSQHSDGAILHYAILFFLLTNGYISIRKHYDLIQTSRDFRIINDKNRSRLTELKFQKLSEKMSPHFLFNTLNLIHSYIFIKPDAAIKALQYLHNNFSYIINFTDGQSVPLQKEWEFTESYLKLLKMRFSKNVSFSINHPAGLSQIPVPPLSVQPFVENAYKHGIRHSSNWGLIEVTASSFLDGAMIIIKDNGVGLSDQATFSRTLDNIQSRFMYLYRDVRVEMRNNEQGQGVEVFILFYHYKGDNIKSENNS